MLLQQLLRQPVQALRACRGVHPAARAQGDCPQGDMPVQREHPDPATEDTLRSGTCQDIEDQDQDRILRKAPIQE